MKQRIVLGFFLILITSGCNAFSFMDNPSGDTQLLSAARACFDQGNYTCAGKYYAKLSSVSVDQANSETAFEMLSQAGATVSVFMNTVVSNPSAASIINGLANTLSGAGANQTTRLTVFHAYQKGLLVTNTQLKGLVTTVTAITLISEILAEAATTKGVFKQTDLAVNPTTCQTFSGIGYIDASCGPPSGTPLVAGTSVTLSTASDSQMSGSPALTMVQAAIVELSNGLAELGGGGPISSALGSFNSQFIAGGDLAIATPGSEAYRGLLLSFGLGS